MKLTIVGFQRRNEIEGAPYSELYKAHNKTEGRPGLEVVVSKMVALLEHLEREAKAPPDWVCTSHADVEIFNRDFIDYGESVDFKVEQGGAVRVSAHAQPGYYEVKCYSLRGPLLFFSWDSKRY
jgi:hypothetical protein